MSFFFQKKFKKYKKNLINLFTFVVVVVIFLVLKKDHRQLSGPASILPSRENVKNPVRRMFKITRI